MQTIKDTTVPGQENGFLALEAPTTINIIIDYINNLFKPLLKEKEFNYGLLYINYNNALSIMIFNIIYYKGFNLCKY